MNLDYQGCGEEDLKIYVENFLSLVLVVVEVKWCGVVELLGYNWIIGQFECIECMQFCVLFMCVQCGMDDLFFIFIVVVWCWDEERFFDINVVVMVEIVELVGVQVLVFDVCCVVDLFGVLGDCLGLVVLMFGEVYVDLWEFGEVSVEYLNVWGVIIVQCDKVMVCLVVVFCDWFVVYDCIGVVIGEMGIL